MGLINALGCVLLIGGVVLIVIPQSGKSSEASYNYFLGVLFGCLSALSYACYCSLQEHVFVDNETDVGGTLGSIGAMVACLGLFLLPILHLAKWEPWVAPTE